MDEVYCFVEGYFVKEVMDELVDFVIKDCYVKKLIIILVGYEKDINCLMFVNLGFILCFLVVINF